MVKNAKFFLDEFREEMGGRENMIAGVELEIERTREEDTQLAQLLGHYSFALAATNIAMNDGATGFLDHPGATVVNIKVQGSDAPVATVTSPQKKSIEEKLSKAEGEVTTEKIDTFMAILMTVLMNLEHCGFIKRYDRAQRKANKVMAAYVKK